MVERLLCPAMHAVRATAVAAVLVLCGCGILDKDPSCGRFESVSSSPLEAMPPSISPIDDEMLVAGYSFHVRNVCIAEHALVSWTVETRTFPEVGVRVGAVYGRGALKVKGWALTGIHAANNLTYWGELHSLGLKDGFAEDPGDFTMTLEIEFPSDLEFESLDTRGVMHADYHRPRSE